MLGHDNVFPLDPKQFLLGRLTTWISHAFGQSQSLIMGTIPIHAIDALPFLAGFDIFTTQKIVYVFWFFMIGLSMYILARTIQKEDRLFALLATIFYQFNFFILQGWWIGERTKFSAYIAMPFVLAVFLKVYRRELPILPVGILTSFIFFFFNAGGLYGIPLYGGFFISLLVFVVFFSILHLLNNDKKTMARLVLATTVCIAGYLLVNAYFMVPAIVRGKEQLTSSISQSGGISGLIDWASEISANTSIINLMRLQGIAEWYDNPEHPYAKTYLTNPLLIATSFLWPVLVLGSFLFLKKKRIIVYLFLVYLVGLIFAGGTHPPFGFLYTALLKYIPGFVIFRSPYYKFAPAILLSTSLLIASLLWLYHGRKKVVVFSILAVIVLLYHLPYFTGNFFSWRKQFSARLKVPAYVSDFGSWLNGRNPDEGRVLTVPSNDFSFLYSQYDWGYLSFQSLPTLVSNYPVIINNDRLSSDERRLTQKLYTALERSDMDQSLSLFRLLGISSVVLQEDIYINGFPENNLVLHYRNILDNSGYFLPSANFGRWRVYDLKEKPLPKAFITDRLTVIDTSPNEQNVEDFFIGEDAFTSFDSAASAQQPDKYAALKTHSIIPTCINCPRKGKPLVVFPERNVLSDSPLYTLVTLLEKRRAQTITDPKNQIYTLLGLTLKRTSEIDELVVSRSKIKRSFIDGYLTLLTDIRKNFEKLSSLKEKLQIASDILLYLKAERERLNPNLGVYLTHGESTIMISLIYTGISEMEKYLDSFATQYDSATQRVYQLAVDKPTHFNLFVGRDDVDTLITENQKIGIGVDDSPISEVEPTVNKSEKWIPMGKISLAPATHFVKLTLPEQRATTVQLFETQTEFSLVGTNTCFGTTFTDLIPGKLYRLVARYINDFSESLLFYKWELRGGELKLFDAQKLFTSGLTYAKEDLLELSNDATALQIAFCAPNLTEKIIKKQFSVTINEVVYPKLVLRPSVVLKTNNYPVELMVKSTTNYEAIIPEEVRYPMVFIFSERYDDGWRLTGADEHFVANGFANGWIINDKPKGPLSLEYLPQRHFIVGIVISLLTLVGGALLL